MSRFKLFSEKQKQRTKYEAIKSIFQALTITVVAVVAVVVLIPNSPKASFDEVKVFSNEVIYHVSVTDSEGIVEGDKLKIVLENQLNKYESSLDIGSNYGSFTGLTKNTLYSLKVVFDKGFGEEVLARYQLTTDNELVAAITSVDLANESGHYYFIYDISIVYGNIEGYSNWQIRYGTSYDGYEEETYYFIEQLTSLQTSVELDFESSARATYKIYLEALFDGEMVIVDQVKLKSPFTVYGDMYLSCYNDREAEFSVYVEPDNQTEIRYQLEVYRNNRLEQTLVINYDETNHSHDSGIVIKNLRSNSDYKILFKAFYVNPDTLRNEHVLLAEEEIRTLERFEASIEVIEETEFYQVTIRSSSTVLNQGFYRVMYLYDGYWYYYSEESYFLNEDGNGYMITFTIDKSSLPEDYYINIGVSSSDNYIFKKMLGKIEK